MRAQGQPQQLPPATSSAIKIAARTNPALINKNEELKKYVSLVDEQFKTDLASRQKKYVPNRYNRADTNRHQHQGTQSKSAGAQQQHTEATHDATGVPGKALARGIGKAGQRVK